MTTETEQLLTQHMADVEQFQSEMADHLRQTAITLERVSVILEKNEQSHAALVEKVERIEEHVLHPENGLHHRVVRLEESVTRAANIAKWFFGGGLIAAGTSAYMLSKLVDSLGQLMKEMGK